MSRAAQRYAEAVHLASAGLPVTFHGWTRDVYSALAGLHLLIVPSCAREATTRVILEAFAAGVPVVAFRSGGIPEVIDHGRTGFLADSAPDASRMALEVLGRPEMLASIAAQARARWSEVFSLECWLPQMAAALRP